jgi:adenine phosphoribosyltransferase
MPPKGDPMEYVKKLIKDVPDFPKKGIIFKDITPLLNNGPALHKLFNDWAEVYKDTRINTVVAMESRGFFFGVSLALKLGAGFVPVRKPGKLPRECLKESFQLEYGTDCLEIHKDAIQKGNRVLIVDDVLATGGTAQAVTKLVKNCDGVIVGLSFLIELEFLKGREKLTGYPVWSAIKY